MARDPAAEHFFRRLYDENYEALLAYVLRRWPDASEAHDIVADTFLVLWRRLRDAPADEEIPLWLHGVARRVLANHYRTRVRRERLSARFAQIAETISVTDEETDTRLLAREVLQGMLELSDGDREVLLLAAWESLSVGEIAIVLGCSENAATLRLHRARKRLTEVCKKENAEAGHKRNERSSLRRPPKKKRRNW
jgi:RNA polymerase sigma-70 factor (ECF subfamily)